MHSYLEPCPFCQNYPYVLSHGDNFKNDTTSSSPYPLAEMASGDGDYVGVLFNKELLAIRRIFP